MSEKPTKTRGSVTQNDPPQVSSQQLLWPNGGQGVSRPQATCAVPDTDGPLLYTPGQASLTHHCIPKALQDLPLPEALLAVKLSLTCDSLEELQAQLITRFGQNSQKTRIRY